MKILLINPCLRPSNLVKIIPVGLACIATALRDAGYKPDILDIDLHRFTDNEVDDFLATHSYDIVGLGNIISSYKITKRLCTQVKQAMPNTVLVAGNTVATSIPELLLTRVPQVDMAVIGEGDRTIVDIATAITEGRPWHSVRGIAFRDGATVVKTPPRDPIVNIEDIPFPDYTLFEFGKYLEGSNAMVPEPLPLPADQLKTVPFNTARGCPFSCTFCMHAFKSYKYRFYSFKRVIRHFKYYQDTFGVNYLNFWDELCLPSLKRTQELCDAIEEEQVKAFWPISPRGNTFARKDLDLLRRCKSLGALTIGGALESGSPEILRAMNKTPRPEEFVQRYIEQCNTAWEAGLAPQTSIVFGYPQETKETIQQTFEVCRQAKCWPSTGFVLPLPGAAIYQTARDRGLIEDDEEQYLLRIGDRQDLHVNMTQMPDDELVGRVTEGLVNLKNQLGIPLSDDQVIKSVTYKAAKR